MDKNQKYFKWWLSPSLEIYPLTGTHEHWAKERLKRQDVLIPRISIMDEMYALGWIRLILVGTESDIPAGYSENPQDDEGLILAYEYGPNKQPTSKTIKAIKDFAIERGARMLHNDVTNRHENLNESIVSKILKEVLEDMGDYIGGIYQGEVRGERVRTGKVKSAIHKDFPGLFSGQNNTNWRYIKKKNQVLWNLQPEEENIQKVTEWLAKRGIVNPKHKAMYRFNEGMFPKRFNRNNLGTCMGAAALATDFLLEKGVTDFQVVEGMVSFEKGADRELWQPHTWLEIKGRKFDPTKNQWRWLGIDPKRVKYEEVHKIYTPQQYQKLCNRQGGKRKPLTEGFGKPTPQQLIPDDEEELWKLIQSIPDETAMQFTVFDPQNPYGLLIIINHSGKLAVTSLSNKLEHAGSPDKKWHKADDIILRMMTTSLYNYGEDHDVYYCTVPVTPDAPVNEDMSYKELLAVSTPERQERAKNVRARSLPVSIEDGMEAWNFRYKSTPQTTVTDKPFEGEIRFLKGEVGKNDNAIDLKCKVDCGCPDYKYRFAYNNAHKNAGNIGPDSLNQAINRRPKPAYNIGEGLCKHLISLRNYLATKIQQTKKNNLFEAMDDVAKQGPFTVTYYDD